MVFKLAVTLLIAGASGLRRHRKSQATPGEVHGLYTFGAPGTSDPPLTNPRASNGCFPGYRTWTVRKKLLGSTVDIVVPLAGLAGYKHARQAGMQLEVRRRKFQTYSCNRDVTKKPNGWKRKRTSLHSMVDYYIPIASKVSPFMYNMSTIGLAFSQTQNEQEVADAVRPLGWRLVHMASQDGKGTKGGFQVSHLLQQPQSLECIITFQGTKSIGDWLANIDISRVSYCGLSQRVHRGFRDHMKRITGSPVFQNQIKPYLPSCSKVYVTGHSLGGAMADLFTACVQQALKAGQAGYEDYKIVGWNKGRARALTYIDNSA